MGVHDPAAHLEGVPTGWTASGGTQQAAEHHLERLAAGPGHRDEIGAAVVGEPERRDAHRERHREARALTLVDTVRCRRTQHVLPAGRHIYIGAVAAARHRASRTSTPATAMQSS